MFDEEVRAPRREKGVFVRSDWQPSREPRTATRFSDDGVREFDARIGCWVAVGKAMDRHGQLIEPWVRDDRRSAVPRDDGSGQWWAASCDGQPMWTIEAWCWDAALAEKRRLCELSGYKSGLVRLIAVQG